MFTVRFWKDAAERSIKSAAQAIVTMWGAGQFNILNADFGQTAGIALGMACLSILTSIVSERVGIPDTASLLREE